jgi:hypothetical protein
VAAGAVPLAAGAARSGAKQQDRGEGLQKTDYRVIRMGMKCAHPHPERAAVLDPNELAAVIGVPGQGDQAKREREPANARAPSARARASSTR